MWYYLWKLYEWFKSPLNTGEEYEVINYIGKRVKKQDIVKVVKLDEKGEKFKKEASPLDKSVVDSYKSVLCKNINKDNYDKVVEDLDAFNKHKENISDELTLDELTKFLEVESSEPIFNMDDI
jgi:hypothetical protein